MSSFCCLSKSVPRNPIRDETAKGMLLEIHPNAVPSLVRVQNCTFTRMGGIMGHNSVVCAKKHMANHQDSVKGGSRFPLVLSGIPPGAPAVTDPKPRPPETVASPLQGGGQPSCK